MADRTAAEVFKLGFEALASGKSPREAAKWLLEHARNYDFHPAQMDADDALEKLGLLDEVYD